jgi:hypothetical protein
MAIVGDREFDIVGEGGRYHPVAFRNAHRHGLFAEHVFSRLRRSDGLLGMQVDRRCNIDRIDLIIADQIPPVVIPASSAEIPGELFSQFGAPAIDGDQFAS